AACVVQSFGPNSLNWMLPPGAAPFPLPAVVHAIAPVGIAGSEGPSASPLQMMLLKLVSIPFVAGWVDALLSVPLSQSAVPNVTEWLARWVVQSTAVVARLGVFGATVKHSFAELSPESILSSTPLTPAALVAAFGSKWAAQQYVPTFVRVALPETTVTAVAPPLTALCVTSRAVDLLHWDPVPAGGVSGPQR